MLVTAKGINDLIDGILAEHTQLGAHTFVNLTLNTLTSTRASATTNVTASAIGSINATQPLEVLTGAYQPLQSYTPSAGGTATLNLALGNDHRITMPAGNITVALSNGVVGQKFLVSLTQDAVGSRTVTFFTTIKWAGGTAPTLSTIANYTDTFGFIIVSTGIYHGFIVGQGIH